MAANKTTALATALPTVEDYKPISADEFAGQEVQLSAFMYSTKLCTYVNMTTKKTDWYPVIGIGLDVKSMSSDQYKTEDNDGSFNALVVQLTRPCPVPESAGSKTLKMLPVGSIVLIPYNPDTSKLADAEKYFRDEKFAWEVYVKPGEQETLRNGHTLNHWVFRKGAQHLRSDLLTGAPMSNGQQTAAGAA